MTHLKFNKTQQDGNRTHYDILCGSLAVGHLIKTIGYHRIAVELRTRKGKTVRKEYPSIGIAKRAAAKLYRR